MLPSEGLNVLVSSGLQEHTLLLSLLRKCSGSPTDGQTAP